MVSKRWHEIVVKIFNEHNYLLLKDTNEKVCDRIGNFSVYGMRHCMDTVLAININQFRCKQESCRSPGYYHKYMPQIVPNFANLKAIYLCLLNSSGRQKNVLNLITNSCGSQLRQMSVVIREKASLHYSEISPFCEKFPSLRVFQMEALELNVSTYGIDLLFKSLQRLEVFVIMDAIHSYERKLQILHTNNDYFKTMSPYIRVIKVSGNLLDLQAVRRMSENKFNLLHNLHICDFDSLETIQLISTSFANLSSLTVSNSWLLKSESDGRSLLESVVKLPKLKKLHIFIESEIPIFTYESFKLLENCKSLTTLQVESTILTNDCVEAICRFAPQLVNLDLTYVLFNENPDYCIAWIERLTKLKALKLSASPELSDSSLIGVIKSCQLLEHLDVSRSEKLSVETFKACVESAQNNPHKKMTAYLSLMNRDHIQPIHDSMSDTFPQNLVVKYRNVTFV